MKTRFRSFLKYQIPIFVVIIAFTTLVYLIVYEWIITPKYNETINLFVGVYVDNKSLEKDLYNGYESTTIKKINVDSCNNDNLYYSIVFNTRGVTNTDFIIIPLGLINEGSYSSYFASLPTESINTLVGKNLTYFVDDGKEVGINVTEYLKDYVHTDEELYLFVNKKSDKVCYINYVNYDNDSSLICFKNIFKEGVE